MDLDSRLRGNDIFLTFVLLVLLVLLRLGLRMLAADNNLNLVVLVFLLLHNLLLAVCIDRLAHDTIGLVGRIARLVADMNLYIASLDRVSI